MSCGKCGWYAEDYAGDENTPAFGQCEWPSSRLPWSLRYGNRERLGVSRDEGDGCSCFDEKKGADNRREK